MVDRSLPETRKYQGAKQSGKRGYVEPEPEPAPEPNPNPTRTRALTLSLTLP